MDTREDITSDIVGIKTSRKGKLVYNQKEEFTTPDPAVTRH
jgi:hypothetical protein